MRHLFRKLLFLALLLVVIFFVVMGSLYFIYFYLPAITYEELRGIHKSNPANYEQLYQKVHELRPFYHIPSPREVRANPLRYFEAMSPTWHDYKRPTADSGKANEKPPVYRYLLWGGLQRGEIFTGAGPYVVYLDEELNILYWSLDY